MTGTAIAKVTAVLAGSAGIGTLGVYYSGLLDTKKSSIRSLVLKNKAIKVIAKGESGRWGKIWTKYKEANKDKDQDSWNLQGWKKTDNDSVVSSLEDKCLKEADIEVTDENDSRYKFFVQWCTRTSEIQDRLIEEGYTLIPQTDSDETWKANFDEYKKTENTIKIHSVTIETGDSRDTDTHLNKLKNGCKTALEAPFDDQNYLNSLEGIKKWCTTKISG